MEDLWQRFQERQQSLPLPTNPLDWDALPEQVRQYGDWWDMVFGEFTDKPRPDPFVEHIYWLVPLAELLQRQPLLRHLYPFLHHAQLDLRTGSDPLLPLSMIMFYASAPGHFEATKWPDKKRLAEGDAATVVAAARDAVRETPTPPTGEEPA